MCLENVCKNWVCTNRSNTNNLQGLARYLIKAGPRSTVSGVSNMRVREAALRLKRFEAEEKAQRVSDLEQMIGEFEEMALDLERQITAEEERTGIRDKSHFAYSTFARSATQRRENLMASVGDLRDRLESALTERDEALAELDQADSVGQRDNDRIDAAAADAR